MYMKHLKVLATDLASIPFCTGNLCPLDPTYDPNAVSPLFYGVLYPWFLFEYLWKIFFASIENTFEQMYLLA